MANLSYFKKKNLDYLRKCLYAPVPQKNTRKLTMGECTSVQGQLTYCLLHTVAHRKVKLPQV